MQCVGLGAVKLFRVLAKAIARDICGSAEVVRTHVDNRFALVRCSGGDTYVEAELRLSRVAGSDEVYKFLRPVLHTATIKRKAYKLSRYLVLWWVNTCWKPKKYPKYAWTSLTK